MPIELHIPGYKFCGPGTKLAKRLARGDIGVNGLDEACKEHDIAYSREVDLSKRHLADQILAKKAIERLHSPAASIGEKAAAFGVAAAMKAKVKLGMGCSSSSSKTVKRKRKVKQRKRKVKQRKRVKSGGSLSLKNVIKHARVAIKGVKKGSVKDAIKVAVQAVKKAKKKKSIKSARVIPIPKRGGFLPLIPIFAGLSALGALGGGAAGIAKAINDAKEAKEKLEESKRHNRAMEGISMGKGFYMKPYKQGFGLFLGNRKALKGYP